MADRWLVSGEYERGDLELAIDVHLEAEVHWYRLHHCERDLQLNGTGNVPTPELAKRELNRFEARTGEGR
jgi:hypothetical protein